MAVRGKTKRPTSEEVGRFAVGQGLPSETKSGMPLTS